MGDGLRLRVFGAVEAWRDGVPQAIGGPKPRLLLAVLLARRGAVVSTDRLCEELWGDEQPASPARCSRATSRGCAGSSNPTR